MKTVADLDTLIPTIVGMVLTNDNLFGDRFEHETNTVTYDKDGWFITVSYDCNGEWDCDNLTRELRRGWGKVRGIEATYGDECTEEKRYSFEECRNLRLAINKALREM